MEGSHNQQVRRAQTSLNPETPSTSYQVNVKRNKTRKWVEAKVQNYDGDDWGADEYDEESDPDHDSSATPPPPINPSLRTFSGTDLLHSRHNTPSPASSLSALPSLRSQVPQPPAVPPASESPRIAVASPDVSDLSVRSNSDSIASPHVVSPQSVQGRDGDGSNLPLAGIAQLPSQVQQQQQQGPGGFNVSRTPSFEQAVKPTSTPPVAGDRFATPPQNPAASPPPADQPPPVIYSPNNYSRLPDENEDHAALALAPTTTAGSDQGAFAPKPLVREDTRDTWERDEEPSSHADQPGVPEISPDVAESQIDRGRMSVSPKLPDLSRMSAFGADLFSSSTSNNFPKERVIDENQADRGEEPAASPAAAPPAIDYSQTAPPTEGQDHSEVPGGAPLSQSSDLFPGRNIPSIPPLRTPSPHEPRTAVPMFESQGTKITPTEPLQPGREESLADVENPQLFQRMQTYSTSTSSPVKDSPLKENDVLSDEIMRTLSPSGAVAAEVKPFSDGPQLHPAGDRSAVRESSYTLGDYDSYWADAAASLDDASAPPHETLATPQPPQQSVQGQQQGEGKEEPQELQEPQSSLRRRFSWEDEQRTPTGQPQTPTPLPAPPADDGSSAPALHLTAPSGQPLEPSVTNLTNESRSHSPVSQLSQAPPAGSGVGAPLALQTSVLGHDSSFPEPPSPVSVSVLSDKPSTTAREQSCLSIADEKVLVDQGSVSLETGTPPPAESHPAISSPTSAASVPAPQTPVHNAALPQAKAMNFKDIMALSTPSERIDKYGEARQILAARDSGLDTWLVHMSTEHPELPASKSVPGQTSQSTNNAALPAGAQPSGQQPYHQHSPSTAGPQSGGGGGARSRLGGLSMPSQMSGSALSHSGKEIGNKSKEFMHSAGKMGKGLLSKGKSKLRGSGDKVDTIPPDHPVPHKPHRRSTWRFSLEPRPQDDPAPHTSSVEIIETTPPQLPDPSPISPLNAASGAGSAFPWTVENDMPHQDVSPVKESIDDDERVRLDELVIANSFLPGAYASAEHDEGFFPAGQPGASDVNLDMVTPDDWVVVQHQGEQSQAQRMSLSHRAMATQDIAGPGAAIGSAVGAAAEANAPQHQAWQPPTQTQTQNQPQSGPDTPQRNSSFIGLPPIRRGSTFGPKPKARRATERFSLDDEDDNADGANGWAVAGADGYDGVHPAQRPGGGFDRPAAAPAEALMNTSKTLPPQPMQGVPLPTAVNFSQGQTPNAGRQYQQPQQHQQHQQQSQQQQYPGGPNPQFAQIGPHNVPPGMPAPILSSLVQKPPPTGSWKLEESHLTAPLQVTKKRSGTDIAQQFAYSAYDKELGLEYPAAPMPPAQGPPGRFRSDVPPSSARRYPDLFSLSPAQDPRQQHIRGQGFPPPQIQQGRPPREGAAGPRQQQQQQQGGPESPASGMAADDRGRRRNSGIFRDIGTRLARATSRERRSSVSDVKPRGDEMSEGSVVTEDASDRKRKRASFFGLSGRPISADQAPRHQAGGEVPTDSHEERKRSLFGVAPLKIGPGNFSRSSTANSAFEQAAGPGSEANPHKRRISDIAKVSGIAGLFGRTRQDRSSLGAMPTSQQSDEQRQTSQASIQTPPMQLPSLDFASDPLESMSSLGFEESFQDYRHEEQPAQKHLFNSQLHSAPPDNFINPQARAVSPLSNIVSAQEGAVPAVVAPPTINQSEQGMPQDHPKIHQDVAGGEDLEAPPGLQADSMDEKTPKLQDFIFQEKMAALQLGGLDDNVSEEEISRSQTVSPDISISSNAKAEEHIPERNEILITPPPETSLPALADSDAINHSAVAKDLPPSIHSFPSVSSLREKSDAKSVEQEEGSVHQTKEEEAAISREPSPQIAKSEISSKVATPASEHQQLHSPALAAVNVSETQSAEPPATPQSQVGPLQRPESRALPESQQLPVSQQRPLSQERFESEPRPISQQRLEPQQGPEPQQEPGPQQRPISQQRLESEQRFESQRPEFQQRPTSQQRPMSQQRPPLAPDQRQQFQQFHAQGSVFPVGGNQPVLQQRPQYPPSVSVSNASIASEASTPIYSTQQSRSHNLFPGLPVSPGRALTQPPDGSAQQKENQGSRWKGFRNRVTEQISQKTQPQQQQPQQQQPPPQLQQQQSQGKTLVGEKIKTNKLLGALRRTSKQPEPVQSQSLEPSPSSRQLPHPNPQPHPQGYQPQPGQVQGPRPPANQNQYLQPSMQQPPNLPRAKTMPAGHVQQQVSPPQGQTRSSEPRYESVPIPRGYAAVHGEGRIVPSPYQPNLRQHLPHGQFAPLQPHMQQQQHPHLHPQQHVQRQWQGAHPPPMSYQHHHQPQPQPAQYHGGQQSPPMVQGPVSAPLPHERPLHMRFPSDPRSDYFNSQSSSSLNTQHNRHNSQGSQNSRVGLPRPPSDLGSNLGKSHSASPQQSERENLPVVDGLRSASRSPAVSVGADQKPDLKPDTKSDKTAESTQPSSLGIDIEKAQQLEEDDLYSATPRKIENGVQPTISRTMSNEQAESSAAAATQANVKRSNTVLAELEDTEEARKRAIRLASQEEKIFYEPEDEMPKMSATSYPGQEWNPFGEQEFADWRED